MDYTPTNRERNQDATRRRMKVHGRGLLTITQKPHDFRPRWALKKDWPSRFEHDMCSNLLINDVPRRRAR